MVIGKAGEVCGRVDKLTPVEKKFTQWVKKVEGWKRITEINASIIQQQKQQNSKKKNN